MVAEIDLMFRTMFAELVQQTMDDRFIADFSTDGWFVSVAVRGQNYWYFGEGDAPGGKKRRYVGPASDPAITKRVEEFKHLKESAKTRRAMVSALVRLGLPKPDRFTGDAVEALANAGLFRLRAVLVGSVAFQA